MEEGEKKGDKSALQVMMEVEFGNDPRAVILNKWFEVMPEKDAEAIYSLIADIFEAATNYTINGINKINGK